MPQRPLFLRLHSFFVWQSYDLRKSIHLLKNKVNLIMSDIKTVFGRLSKTFSTVAAKSADDKLTIFFLFLQ